MFICKRIFWLVLLTIGFFGCKTPQVVDQNSTLNLPAAYAGLADSANTANIRWSQFFTDPYLVRLIDTALHHNRELQIVLKEIAIASNEVGVKNSLLFPKVGVSVGTGLEKVGRYTSQGAGDASTEIIDGKEVPDPLADFAVAGVANWEVDIWRKLHNSKRSAFSRYLSTVEAKNFVLTQLVSEIANTYYELLALDSQQEIVEENITVQTNALKVVRAQKDAGRTTEMAVKKLHAELFKSQSLVFDIQQQIVEAENKLNLLIGHLPQHIARSQSSIIDLQPSLVVGGLPAQLLTNRSDIKQAEQELNAAKLDVKIAKAEFYPSLEISAVLGLQAFKPSYLFKLPESVLYSLVGDLAGPLINRAAIKAEFANANAKQLQALYNYEKTVLNAYLEVSNRLSAVNNIGKAYEVRSKQVDELNQSVSIANDLFQSARVDYFEVLMTQRDALEAKLELIETKKNQFIAVVNVYEALGGGWK